MESIWSQFLNEKRYAHLLNKHNFKSGRLLKTQFLNVLNENDRKESYRGIKELFSESAYNKFLNCFRVYKARMDKNTSSISISFESKSALDYIKTTYGFSSYDDVINVISADYQSNNILK